MVLDVSSRPKGSQKIENGRSVSEGRKGHQLWWCRGQ